MHDRASSSPKKSGALKRAADPMPYWLRIPCLWQNPAPLGIKVLLRAWRFHTSPWGKSCLSLTAYLSCTKYSLLGNQGCGECRGRAVKSTKLKLWCFSTAECGLESPAVTLVSLSFVLRMGCKAIGPMCCVNACKRTQCTYRKRRGSPRCYWLDWQHIAPQRLDKMFSVVRSVSFW